MHNLMLLNNIQPLFSNAFKSIKFLYTFYSNYKVQMKLFYMLQHAKAKNRLHQ